MKEWYKDTNFKNAIEMSYRGDMNEVFNYMHVHNWSIAVCSHMLKISLKAI